MPISLLLTWFDASILSIDVMAYEWRPESQTLFVVHPEGDSDEFQGVVDVRTLDDPNPDRNLCSSCGATERDGCYCALTPLERKRKPTGDAYRHKLVAESINLHRKD